MFDCDYLDGCPKEVMTPIKYFKLSLALPVALPLMLGCVVLLRWLLGFSLVVNGPIGLLSYFLIGALVVGGVPYIVLVSALLRIFRHKSADWYARFVFVLPILFAAMMGVGGTVFELVSEDRRHALGTGLSLAEFSLIFGYPYVFLAHALYIVLHRLGFIQEDSAVRAIEFPRS